ncbi:MAG: alpha amylase N-terminal ig-like domain-containing protein, partial [Kosmotogaceae bacterium]
MDRSSIYHISEHNYAYPKGNDTLAVRVRTRKDDVKKILVYYKNLYDHSERISTTEMKKILTDGICDMYEASLVVEEKRFKYYFELFDVVDHVFLTSDGLLDSFESGSFFYYPYINDDDIFDLPAWAEGEIIYQIFVDRFYDGDPSNNPE